MAGSSVMYLENEFQYKPIVLLVDDEPNNIKLLSQVLSDKYSLRVALNGKEALKRVSYDPKPDLILLDVMMPEMDGYEVCKKLKSNPQTASIPVLFVTARSEMNDEARGFEVGGVDYITKPISALKVLARVKSHISLASREKSFERVIVERTQELELTQKAAIQMLGEAGHYNDEDTGVHIWRMAAYAKTLAQAAELPVSKAEALELAAPMHDTGKIGIADSILKAPRKLTDEEWTIMKTHTLIGHSILSKSQTPLFRLASEVALSHHERWNGTGYPNQLNGKEIPLSARIVAICDVFDALTMKRPYKEAWPLEDAFNEIDSQRGRQFDPDLVESFMSIKDQILRIKEEFDKKEPQAD